jgi:DNA replication protein DnaC
MEIINNRMDNTWKIERIKGNYSEIKAKEAWLDIAKKYIHNPIIGADAKKVWSQLIKYVFADPGSELILDSGIGLVGATGSGKTMTMLILNDFISIDNIKYKRGNDFVNMRFVLESALVIAGEYSRKGYDILHRYSNYANLCIDDLGAEQKNKKYFGDAVNVIQEIIEMRHSNGFVTHFTSNNPLESKGNGMSIQEMYGDRVYSRLVGTCNIVVMNDCDYRIKTK